MKKFKKFISIFCAALVIVAGVFCGCYVGDTIFNNQYNVTNFISAEDLYDDFSQIDYEGKTPDQVSGIEAFLVAEKFLNEDKHHEILSNGLIDTNMGVQQTNYNFMKTDGDGGYYEFLSHSSFISVANKCEYVKDGDMVIYIGKCDTGNKDDIVWTDKTRDDIKTYEEFKQKLGRYPHEYFTYIVSSKTVTNVSECTMKDGYYYYLIELDPQLSTIYYVEQVKTCSGCKNVRIDRIAFELYLDENFKIHKCTLYEDYAMNFGMNIETSGVYNVNFTYF